MESMHVPTSCGDGVARVCDTHYSERELEIRLFSFRLVYSFDVKPRRETMKLVQQLVKVDPLSPPKK